MLTLWRYFELSRGRPFHTGLAFPDQCKLLFCCRCRCSLSFVSLTSHRTSSRTRRSAVSSCTRVVVLIGDVHVSAGPTATLSGFAKSPAIALSGRAGTTPRFDHADVLPVVVLTPAPKWLAGICLIGGVAACAARGVGERDQCVTVTSDQRRLAIGILAILMTYPPCPWSAFRLRLFLLLWFRLGLALLVAVHPVTSIFVSCLSTAPFCATNSLGIMRLAGFDRARRDGLVDGRARVLSR